MRRQLSGAALAALLLLSPARAEEVSIATRPIERFRIGSAETRLGAFTYLGGFSYRAPANRLVAGISSIRMREGGRAFLTVTDTGYWFAGRIRRDEDGRPVGIEDARISPILSRAGQPQPRKGMADAEGLAIDGDTVLVSFEGNHRIERFRPADAPFDARAEPVALPIPRRELRSNEGIETITVAPRGSPLAGETVIVSERSVDASGNLLAAFLGRGSKGLFTVRREAPWSVTDGAFLADGDLLLLERRYEGFTRIGMRIRRLPAAALKPGAVADGPVIMEADLGNEIDNMEGIDAWRDADGRTIVSLVSDDNASFLQRNLYLEFVLEPGAQAATGGASR
ncbi:esterase-like activity of phytase family protein [Aureimonas sp. AU4]|uniref:esterase-like activity of phytase family protein n=1 Tax=Aureimonas sp. AU4 TaxID=1638163 RepID=UPI000783B51B|nr:esterase-like activity of phytase family protein [Aureimonas sp. AU4]